MATPTEHATRAYEAFLRGPADLNTFAFGTVDAYRGGVQHHRGIVGFPEPVDNPLNDFGIQQGGGFAVEIADEGANDWFLLREDGSFLLREDGSKFILEY
jgi:hypothetical protein